MVVPDQDCKKSKEDCLKKLSIGQLVIERERRKTELKEITLRYKKQFKELDDAIVKSSMQGDEPVLPFKER